MFRICGVIKLWDPSWRLRHWWSKFDSRYLGCRIRICFSNLTLWTLWEKTDEGETESIIFIFVLSSFLSVNYFLEIWANHFSLLTFESFKPSFPLFLTIERRLMSFSLSAQFEQLNTAKNLPFSNSYFLFTLLSSFTVYLLTHCLLDRCF